MAAGTPTLQEAYGNARTAVTHFCEVDPLSIVDAETHAQTLEGQAERVKQGIFPRTEETTEQRTAVSFSFASNTFSLLTRREIHFAYQLQKILSTVFRIFIELTAYGNQQVREGYARGTFRESIAMHMIKEVKAVRKALPLVAVRARFELKCALEALKKLRTSSGLARRIMAKHGEDIGMALLETALSVTPAPPFADWRPLARESIVLTKEILSSLQSKWYANIWVWRWLDLENMINNVTQFLDPKTQEDLAKWSHDHNLAFYMTLLLKKIWDRGDEELKTLVLTGRLEREVGEPLTSCVSLFHLATHVGPTCIRKLLSKTQRKDSGERFWPVRLQALEFISEIIPQLDPENPVQSIHLRPCITHLAQVQNTDLKEHPVIVGEIPEYIGRAKEKSSEEVQRLIDDICAAHDPDHTQLELMIAEVDELPEVEESLQDVDARLAAAQADAAAAARGVLQSTHGESAEDLAGLRQKLVAIQSARQKTQDHFHTLSATADIGAIITYRKTLNELDAGEKDLRIRLSAAEKAKEVFGSSRASEMGRDALVTELALRKKELEERVTEIKNRRAFLNVVCRIKEITADKSGAASSSGSI